MPDPHRPIPAWPRLLLHALAVFAVAAALPRLLEGQDNSRGKSPNVLLILADDLGYGDLRCYNDEARCATPNVDRLASDGMRFTDAHSASTVCTPSRYGLLTGRMPFRTGYRGVFAGVGGPSLIEPGRLTLASMLRNAGYRTACVGKWHVGLTFEDEHGKPVTGHGVEAVSHVDFSRRIPDGPIDRGFDRFFGTACCPTTDWLYAFIDQDRIPVPPAALLDKSSLPQHPYASDNRRGMIAPGYEIEEVDLVFLDKSRAFLEEHAANHRDRPFFLFHSMQAVHLPSFAAKRYQGKTDAGPHGDFIHEMDAIVGELLATLERLDLAQDTLVIFTSDNGPEVLTTLRMRADHQHDAARPWRGLKRDDWEGGHRVPFLVRWPGRVKPASTSSQPVSLTDVVSTCAHIVETNLPENAAEDSFDLTPILLGTQSDTPLRPYVLQQTWTLQLSIRRGRWKYLDHRGSGGNDYAKPPLDAVALAELLPSAPGQLYDLESDPGETRNVYTDHQGLVQELKDLLEQAKTSGRSRPR